MKIQLHFVMLDDVTRAKEPLHLTGFTFADLEEAKKVASFLTEQACCIHSVRTYDVSVEEVQKALKMVQP